MSIEQSINKDLKQVVFKIRLIENGSGSGGGSSAMSDTTCHKRGKKFHSKKDFRSKVNVSGGNPPNKSANKFP